MFENATSLNHLLGRSKIRRRILFSFVADTNQRWHLREIARRADTSAGTASRELARLVEAGLLRRVEEGNQVYFEVVPSVVFRAVSEIVRQTSGARTILREALEGLPGVESAVIFGSYAAGMTRSDSDVDLLVIGTPDRDLLTERLERAGREIRRPVNEIVLTPAEVDERRVRSDGLIESIDAGRTIEVLP